MKTFYNYLKFRSIVSVFVVVLFTVSGCNNQQHKNEIYVSIDGNDTSDGSILKPLATISAAVKKVRSIRELGNTEPMTIYLREGRHYLKKTLVLGIDDGITTSLDKVADEESTKAYLTFAAYPNEEPIISAGKPVNG